MKGQEKPGWEREGRVGGKCGARRENRCVNENGEASSWWKGEGKAGGEERLGKQKPEMLWAVRNWPGQGQGNRKRLSLASGHGVGGGTGENSLGVGRGQFCPGIWALG